MEANEQPRGAQTRDGRDPGTWALVVMAVLLVGGVLTYLGPVLKPFLLAVFLYYVTKAAADALVRWRCPSGLAYLGLFVAAVAVTVTLAVFVSGQAVAFRDQWPRYQQRMHNLIGGRAAGAGQALDQLFAVSSRDVFTFVFATGAGLVELVVMTFFYLLFLILGARRLAGRVQRAFPGERGARLLAISRQVSAAMEQFLKVKTLVSAGMALSAAAILYPFGLDRWPLWAFLFFALNYVTYIGSMVACLPPIVLAYLDLPSPVLATVLAILVVSNRVVWIDYIETRLSGKHLNIDSVLLFLWLAYWGWVWGVLGLILAFPMITCLRIILEHLEATRPWAVLMSEE
jgi:predicted PurR-regulated permease PerM